MKFINLIAAVFCLMTTQFVFAADSTTPDQQRVYKSQELEAKPQFQGDNSAIVNYFATELNYPEQARENAIMGTVVVQFIVDEKGQIQNPQIIRGLGFGCDEEVLRTITKMPLWKPGVYKGAMVKSKVVIPVRFELTGIN